MNLIEDRWIPVITMSGARLRIAPWQLTLEFDEDPLMTLCSPRPDMDGALLELLIGLLTTAYAPKNHRAWRKSLSAPPSPDALREAMLPLADHFELGGDGARFMQDLDVEPGLDKQVGQLLIDEPGANTIKKNIDHFVERDRVERLCAPCAAAALYTLQTYAPSGGAGHRTSLRGGGPLTTLIVGDTLWESVWFNVLSRDLIEDGRHDLPSAPASIFPWLASTRTSEKKSRTLETQPIDTHPLQVFWGMPRRIRLNIEQDPASDASSAACSLCSEPAAERVRGFNMPAYGVNYVGPWRHPLTPYVQTSKKDKLPELVATHPQPTGLPYRNWLGLFFKRETKKNVHRLPARVVQEFVANRQRHAISFEPRLRCFGYDMDNMKARCWYESLFPYILPDDTTAPESRELFAAHVERLVDAAGHVVAALAGAVNDTFGDPNVARRAFWSETEADFYDTLRQLADLDDLSAEHATTPLNWRWRATLGRAALAIFERHADLGHFAGRDPATLANAYSRLRGAAFSSKKLRAILGLDLRKNLPPDVLAIIDGQTPASSPSADLAPDVSSATDGQTPTSSLS